MKSRISQLSSQKQIFMKDHREITSFAEMIDEIRPTCILGASAQRGAFTPEILKKMGEINQRPVIFALSNPTSKAECTAAEAYENTDGRAVFASGSPFPTWEKDGKTYYPGQGNNSYIFPGVALAVIASGIHHISEDVFLLSAEVHTLDLLRKLYFFGIVNEYVNPTDCRHYPTTGTSCIIFYYNSFPYCIFRHWRTLLQRRILNKADYIHHSMKSKMYQLS